MLEGFKGWILSKTIWGAIVAMLSTLAGLLGALGIVNISGEEVKTVMDMFYQIITAVIALAGAVMAIIGRVRATQKIG